LARTKEIATTRPIKGAITRTTAIAHTLTKVMRKRTAGRETNRDSTETRTKPIARTRMRTEKKPV